MEPEFAPEYSTKERVQKLAVILPLAMGTAVTFQWWFLPLLRRFSENAYCQTVLGVPAQVVLFYGLFIGFPVLIALVGFAMTIRSSLKSIQTRRYPPPGEKVFRRTKVRIGWPAVAIATVRMVPVLYLLGLAVWGYGPATELIKKGQAHPRVWHCAAKLGMALNTSMNPDSTS